MRGPGGDRVLMVPYFLSAGVHLLRDLTAARDELARRHPGVEFRLGPPLGPHPLLDELVAERIASSTAGEPRRRLVSTAEIGQTLRADGLSPTGADRSGRLLNARRIKPIDTNRPKG